MRRQISLFTMLTAWLLATGSHWDLVQTFAWGRMIATYSQTMPLARAVKLTFTPGNLCGVCEVVSLAKQQGGAAVPFETKVCDKIPLVYEPQSALFIEFSGVTEWILSENRAVFRDRGRPPVPPPRGMA